MRYLALIATLVLLAMPSLADGSLRKGGTGTGGAAVPGLVNGIGDESTEQWLYGLKRARGANNLTKVHFSSEATGWWPLGVDEAGCGSTDDPCRTLFYCSKLWSSNSSTDCVWDPGDTWDLADIADVGGGSVTESMTIDDTADTITLNTTANWNSGAGTDVGLTLIGGDSTADARSSRIELSGTSQDGTYTVLSVAGNVLTTNEDLTVGETGSFTVQEYREKIAITDGCSDGVDPSVCAAFSGGDPTGRERPTFDCSNMANDEHFIGPSLIDNAIPSDPMSCTLVQSAIWNECPNIHNVAGVPNPVNQDVLRTSGGSCFLTVGVHGTGLKGDNNQLFTSHGDGCVDLHVGMSCVLGDQAADRLSQCFFTACGNSHSIIASNKRFESQVATADEPSQGLIGSTFGGNGTLTVIGPDLIATASPPRFLALVLTVQAFGAPSSSYMSVINTSIRGISSGVCNGSIADCGVGVFYQIPNNSGQTEQAERRIYRSTFTGLDIGVYFNGQGGAGEGDNFTDNIACTTFESLVPDSNGDAIAYFGGIENDTLVDANIRQTVWDENEGTEDHFRVNNIHYDTQADAVDGNASGFTAFFTDAGTYESGGTGSDGNVFCSVDAAGGVCDPIGNDLTAVAACAGPECHKNCTEPWTEMFPVETWKHWKLLTGEEIRGIHWDASVAQPVNVGKH